MKKVSIFLFVLLLISTFIWLYGDTNSNLNQTANIENIASNVNNRSDLTDDELKNKIGQMIMVGFSGSSINEDADIVKVIKDIKIGGVILFTRSGSSNIIN